MTNQTKGIIFAFLAAFISGISIFINKFAVTAISPPLVFTATKNIGVGLLILSILIATKKWRKILTLSRKEIWQLILIGIIGGSLPFYLFFTGLSQTSAINAAIIQKTLVIWVALLAIPFLKERISPLQIAAVALLFYANLLTGGFKKFAFNSGELMILAATVLWAVENIIARKVLKNLDPDLVTAARMGLGSVILITAAVILYPASLTRITYLSQVQWFWLSATALALLSYVSCWYRALKLAPAITVTAVLVSSTLVTNILSVVFINGSWTGAMTSQALVIILGIILFLSNEVLQWSKTKASPLQKILKS